MEVESRYIRSLLQSAQAGNNAALEQLLEMNMERIYALSHRLSANQEEAERLASTVLFEAWQRLRQIRTDVPFNQWLESLTISIALQQHREPKAEKKKWNFFKKKKIDTKEPDSRLTPLGKEICMLPADERVVFVLHRLEKYSFEELSGMMLIPVETVEKLFQNANDLLLKSTLIHTPEELSKKAAELPDKLKANKKILTEALSRIYEKKMEDWVEPEPELTPPETEVITEEPAPEQEKVKIKKEIGVDIPAASPRLKMRIGWAFVILLAAAGIYFLIITGSKSWRVSSISGSVSIDGNLIEENSSLSMEETIETGENSSATIELPETGRMIIGAETILRRPDKKNTGEFIAGKIQTDLSGSPGVFNLSILGTTISNHSGAASFKVETRDEDRAWLLVTSGNIIAFSREIRMIAAKEYVIEIDRASGSLVPYYNNTDPELINAVNEFASSKSEFFIERIVSLAAYNDAITLWNLLKLASPGKRLLIYGKLKELFPHPDTISKEDIIGLDEEKLLLWLKEIEEGY